MRPSRWHPLRPADDRSPSPDLRGGVAALSHGHRAGAEGGGIAMATDARQAKDALLKALLPDVPFDGWTVAAMGEAAERAGLDATQVADLFPAGPRDAVAWFSRWADRETLTALETLELPKMKVR